MERKRHKPIIVRRGDWWVFTTNNGNISRTVRSVSSAGVVSYEGHAGFKQCLLSTFRRWARGASLESAEDWTGRE